MTEEELIRSHYNVFDLYRSLKSKQKQKRKEPIPEKLMKRYRRLIMHHFRGAVFTKGKRRIKWKAGATWSEMLKEAYPVDLMREMLTDRNVLLDSLSRHDINWHGAQISIPSIS